MKNYFDISSGLKKRAMYKNVLRGATALHCTATRHLISRTLSVCLSLHFSMICVIKVAVGISCDSNRSLLLLLLIFKGFMYVYPFFFVSIIYLNSLLIKSSITKFTVWSVVFFLVRIIPYHTYTLHIAMYFNKLAWLNTRKTITELHSK